MIDPQQLAELVDQEIKKTVHQQVQETVNRTDWLQELEVEIIDFVQQRIYARFNNLGNMPDLVQAVQQSVEKLFSQGFVPEISSYVDQKQIQQTIDLAVEKFVSQSLDSMSLDPAWVQKIDNLVERRMIDRLADKLTTIDLDKQMRELLYDKKDIILEELSKNFRSTGIRDNAATCQLTLMNGVVVVEHETVTNDLTVERNTNLKGDVTVVGDLAVKGRVNIDSPSWQELSRHIGNITYERFKHSFAKDMTDDMLATISRGIDFTHVTIDGSRLVDGDELSPGIQKSSLTRVGELENITVRGNSRFNNTLTVNKGRCGINTDSPDSALTIWDEEVTISAGKISLNTGYIGTSRNQNLQIGVNRQSQIELGADGMTTIKNLKIGKNRITWGDETPNYSGTKGDVVFNQSITPDSPFAWICLGAYRWQSLRAAK